MNITVSKPQAVALGFLLLMGIVGTIEQVEESSKEIVSSIYVRPVTQDELAAYVQLQKATLSQREKQDRHELEIQSGKVCRDCH